MSDQPSPQGPGPSRKFLPEVKPLESRLLLSRQVSFPDGTSFIFPTFIHLPRTVFSTLDVLPPRPDDESVSS